MDHSMSNRELVDQLLANGIRLEEHYVGRLRRKVDQEKALRADRITLNQAIAAVSDTLTETTRLAWQIALNPVAKAHDRIAAMREIRKAHTDMFEILFDAGIFTRKLGMLEHEIRNAPLSDEQKKNIREAFVKWGLIKLENANNDIPANN